MDTRAFFSNRKTVILLATFTCLLWGSAYPAIKNGYAMFGIAQDDIPSKLVFAGYRFIFAGLLLLVMALIMRRPFKLSLRKLGEMSILGASQTAFQYVFFYVGLAYTTGVKGSILNSTGTFFSVLMAHFIYKNDRLSWNKSVGCLIGFIGVMVVNFVPGALDFHFTLLGEGFIIIAAFVLSAASIYGKRISQNIDSMVLTGFQLGIGGVLLTVLGYAMGGELTGFNLASSSLLIYMVFLSSAAFSLWTVLLKYNRVGLVTVFSFTIPIFGAILSAIFLGESIFEWKNLIALVLVCSGIWLVTKEKTPR